ncbi:septation protein A [Undibacterium sp. Jales W-56]|uniref:septation protein A n=1 Tax=Undibacterium sp. Jales W-56 TaxID=2897325 RepID=UPI0021D27A32|nr:septation protein A [Undibacterium sp. Jales W-56]MCU6433234.1 septation protein A [Undibacterium sp. Jales W-56]
MKFLFDIFPVILFFISFKLGERNLEFAQSLVDQYLSGLISGGKPTADLAPILLATAIAIIGSVLQFGYLVIRRKKIDALLWISFVVIVGFGSATIYFHSETFIKWKPTVIYWCYAVAFLFAQFLFKKNLLRATMGTQITLPDDVWSKLSLAWIAYFFVMGIVNLYVAFSFPTTTWVSFKLYSIAALPVFIVVQGLFLSKYMEEPT